VTDGHRQKVDQTTQVDGTEVHGREVHGTQVHRSEVHGQTQVDRTQVDRTQVDEKKEVAGSQVDGTQIDGEASLNAWPSARPRGGAIGPLSAFPGVPATSLAEARATLPPRVRRALP
jgi:hypothetical protein